MASEVWACVDRQSKRSTRLRTVGRHAQASSAPARCGRHHMTYGQTHTGKECARQKTGGRLASSSRGPSTAAGRLLPPRAAPLLGAVAPVPCPSRYVSLHRSEPRVEQHKASPHPPLDDPDAAPPPCIPRAAHGRRPSIAAPAPAPAVRPPLLPLAASPQPLRARRACPDDSTAAPPTAHDTPGARARARCRAARPPAAPGARTADACVKTLLHRRRRCPAVPWAAFALWAPLETSQQQPRGCMSEPQRHTPDTRLHPPSRAAALHAHGHDGRRSARQLPEQMERA
jgi:hypothetical protein